MNSGTRLGISSIWIQVEDLAGNRSKPYALNYYIKKSRSIKLRATSGEKERETKIDKHKMKKGELDIKSIEEK